MSPLPPNPPILAPDGSSIYYQGPDLSLGAKPTVIFFALSAYASLYEEPFNQFALHLNKHGIRVFCWDLPFHEKDADPQYAMQQIVKEFIQNPSFLSDYLNLCKKNIDYLIEQQLISTSKIATAGVSRGGFIATHLAASDPRLKIVLGFAPLTEPKPLDELKKFPQFSFDHIALSFFTSPLVHTHLRFYIGNHDTRVSTDSCYHFIQNLVNTAVEHGIRSPTAELILYPSIGHKGHGTPSSIFYEGADWLKQQLLT